MNESVCKPSEDVRKPSGVLLDHLEIFGSVVLKIFVLSSAIYGRLCENFDHSRKSSGDRRQSSNIFGTISEIFVEI